MTYGAPETSRPDRGETKRKTRSPQSLSIISITTGAVSLFLFGAILGTIGVITGIGAIVGYVGDRRKGNASGGVTPLVLGIIGTILGALGLIGMFFVATSGSGLFF